MGDPFLNLSCQYCMLPVYSVILKAIKAKNETEKILNRHSFLLAVPYPPLG